jgi:hypothetical protein
MYDSIKSYLEKLEGTFIDRDHLKKVLTRPITTINGDNPADIRIKGTFNSFTLSENSKVLNVYGSIPECIFGNNFVAPTITQIKECINNTSEHLKLNLMEHGISRIDITDNIITNEIPREYMQYFGSCDHSEKVVYSKNGILYKNYSRHFEFYDKVIQAKKVRRLKDLLNKDNFIACINSWESRYFDVRRVQPSAYTGVKITNRKSYRQSRMDKSYLDQTEAEALHDVQLLYEAGAIEVHALKNIRKDIHKSFRKPESTIDKRDLLQELDRKVRLKAEENKDILSI